MWLRAALVLACLLATGLAQAQAPPPSFFEGRSNEELRALASDPKSDILVRRIAATRLVMSLADGGDFDAADAAARTFARNIDPSAAKYARAARLRGRVHVVAVAALAGVLGIAAVSLVAARRLLREALGPVRRMAPVALGFLLYTGLAGGYLASRYENSSPLPFWWFAALMLPLVVIFRAWSAVGSPRPRARVGRALAAVTATFAVGFLVVEHVNPSFLEGFGL